MSQEKKRQESILLDNQEELLNDLKNQSISKQPYEGLSNKAELFYSSESEDNHENGVDSILYANKECPYCKGNGYIDDDKLDSKPKLCSCVLENKRRHACQIRINALFGQGYSKMTFKNYEPGNSANNNQALKAAMNYVKYFPEFRNQGAGFALIGDYGSGKTHLAVATLIALIKLWPSEKGELLSPYYTSVPNLLRATRQKMDNTSLADTIEKCMTCDIFLLDDLGAEYHKKQDNGMSWVDEQLYLILDYRLTNNLPTIYTTNLTVSELKNLIDPRVTRRLSTKTLGTWKIDKNNYFSNPQLDNLKKKMVGK